MHVGSGLLWETRLIIAHPVSANSFIEHYGMNFPVPPNAMPTRKLRPGGVEGLEGPKKCYISFLG